MKEITLNKLILILFAFNLYCQSPYTIGEYWEYQCQDVIQKFKYSELTFENVAKAIKDINIQHSEIVFKQAMLESGFLTSKLAIDYNNLFGMRTTGRQFYAMKGDYKGYSIYCRWIYSIADYKLWQGTQSIKGDYYEYLVKRKYAVSLNYIRDLKRIRINKNIKYLLNDKN